MEDRRGGGEGDDSRDTFEEEGRMKMNNKGVNLKKYPITMKMDEDLDCRPLSLIELSQSYSISLSTHQREVETVAEECWREEWRNQSTVWTHNLYKDDSYKIAQDQSKFSAFLLFNQV